MVNGYLHVGLATWKINLWDPKVLHPSRRIQIRKYNCCVVYRDGITNGVQPGGVRSVVMMPNFINHLHLATSTSLPSSGLDLYGLDYLVLPLSIL